MFVPLIDRIPEDFEVFGGDPDHQVLSAVAESDDGIRVVGVLTSLIPFDDNGSLAHELKFGISVTGDEADEAFVLYDRDMAKGFLPGGVRPLVIPCVCKAVEALIEAVQPTSIYRVTNATRPPEKALSKHNVITHTLLALGHSVQECGTDDFNRVFWRSVR